MSSREAAQRALKALNLSDRGRRIAMVDDLLLQAHNQEVEHA